MNSIIQKPQTWKVKPNLLSYPGSRESFTWESVRDDLSGLPGGKGLNIAHEALDRHVKTDRANQIAIRWIAKNDRIIDFTFLQLSRLSNRFANVLRELKVGKGDRVFALAGRIPELYVAALGSLKNRSIFTPLFSAFGPEPIRARLTIAKAEVLITTESLYLKKIQKIRRSLPFLKHVIIIGEAGKPSTLPDTLDYSCLMEQGNPEFQIASTDPEDVALLHFTSGTTGTPKGAIHVHQAVLSHHITGKLALDFHPQDIFWCTADPGWVTGTSYGIIAPLTNGVTSIIDEADFNAERWYGIVQNQKVSIWYTAPTAIRMMMKAGMDLVRKYEYPNLRFIASVGEPLNPEAVIWGNEAFGMPIHDNWWQTETGGIMIANFASMDIRPGSMGKPLPGIDATIVHKEGNTITEITEPGVQGELALRPGWPSMFRGYWNEPERYRKCFIGGWYLSGDLARKDSDGYFWFVGRKDDVIKTSGHLIGPFEVESVLLEHKAVAEAGVIGKPDPVAMEVVKAFVSLKPGFEASEDLQLELLGFARSKLGAVVAPKEIEFVTSIPKTRSGKIMRRLLKARDLGLPEGDISTLEEA